MASSRPPHRLKSDLHSTRLRFPETRSLNADHLIASSESDIKALPRFSWLRNLDLSSFPWLGWLFIYAFVQFFFSISRCLTLKALVTMYGTSDDYTPSVKISALGLGFLEDFVCTTYFACALWMFDTLKHSATERYRGVNEMTLEIVAGLATFAVSWLLFIGLMAPFVADMLLVVYRDMRFSVGLVATLFRERHYLKAAPISVEEVHAAYLGAIFLVVVSMLFALVRTWLSWTDLSLWNPLQIMPSTMNFLTRKTGVKASTAKAAGGVKYEAVALEEGVDGGVEIGTVDKLSSQTQERSQGFTSSRALRITAVLVGLVMLPAMVVVVCGFSSPLVAYAALNATLNELFLHAFEPAASEVDLSRADQNQTWVERFIDDAELHDRYGNDTLYRRTTGFTGDLAFNVSIDNDNPPNVLVIGVESFRYRDSRYLVGQEDPSDLFKGTNMTIVPEFDRWAKRGVALRNIWSSIPTSRSLESLLFAQLPYQSNVQTGITGGKADTQLSGLPQLFSEKGYQTFFTTGSSITLDRWDVFLPSHGYDIVWNDRHMKNLAEKTLNISREDWGGTERRGFGWGVHDDLSFKLLGDLLVKRTRKQKQAMARGEKKTPMFLTHYTISSHEPFASWPTWYEYSKKPDFSPMFEGEKNAARIERYMKVRYFTDMELGKFMDRMEREGVLNDTIVVIVGDHGQAPEVDNSNLHEESVTRVPAAIIAEGRLGDAVGLVIDDAAEQYDILNTLADITGLPEGGFLQNGVGRSLKRKLPFGERVVYSNDPMRKMAIVRGHKRLRYDAVTDVMMLHDTEIDYHMTTDLLPFLSPEELEEWDALRDDGRWVTSYYKKRWDGNCLLEVKCDESR